MKYKVGILLGSESDRKYVEKSMDYYEYFNIDAEVFILSAHRNPSSVADFALNARNNGYSVLVCGAGMAAHLAGAVKANSTLPVVGVPMPGGLSDGLDALLSTVQMPKGVPVATMSMGNSGSINAAILCAEILSLFDEKLVVKLSEFKKSGCTI